jgi:hypothetical protein
VNSIVGGYFILIKHVVSLLNSLHLFVAMFPVVDLSAGYEATSSVENSEI